MREVHPVDPPPDIETAPSSPVEVHELVKEFPSAAGPMRRAVDRVSFRVAAGEIYGLLGPNGAGKTTTLRILSGLMQPTAGRVFVNGVDVQADPLAAKRCIGFLTANTGLYQRLSPRELLPYFAELNGLDAATASRRVAELIDLLGMRDFADLRCGALSTGQKQRTNIARALIADPPVLVMDEPTLGLDVLTNRVILDFIRRQRAAGKAVLLSTHYLDEAETLCDRIGLLHEGRLVAEGAMSDLRARTGLERLTDIFLALARPEDGEVQRVPPQTGVAPASRRCDSGISGLPLIGIEKEVKTEGTDGVEEAGNRNASIGDPLGPQSAIRSPQSPPEAPP